MDIKETIIQIYQSEFIKGIIIGISIPFLIWLARLIFLRLTNPKLEINFNKSNTFDELVISNISGNPLGLFVHLDIRNKRRKKAERCKVYLLKMEKEENNIFTSIDIRAKPILKWANENESRGYEELEILGNNSRRVDFVHSIKKRDKFLLFVEEGERGIPNGFPNGKYRFTVQASGSNTNIVIEKFILDWKGKFEKNNINVYKEKTR